MSVKQKVILLISVFFLSTLTSVAASYFVIISQKHDARIIDISGRQRMLSQKIAKDVLNIHLEVDAGAEDVTDAMQRLKGNITLFDRSLNALIEGGVTTGTDGKEALLPKSVGKAREELLKVGKSWKTIRPGLSSFLDPNSDIHSEELILLSKYLVEESEYLLEGSNSATVAFKTASERKTLILKYVQFLSLSLAFIVAILSWLLSNRIIVKPLIHLSAVIEKIEAGDLGVRAEVLSKDDEIGALAEGINRMTEAIRKRDDDLKESNLKMVEKNEKLVELSRLKSEFVANMTHELRTPLNAIIGFSNILLKGEDGELTANQREDLTFIKEGGNKLLEHINNILDFEKIDAGMMRLVKEEMPVGEAIQDVVRMSSGILADKEIRLSCQIEDGLPPLVADRVKFRQIMLNLLSNAIKFTGRGEVLVRARMDGEKDRVEFSVADTGIGMNESDYTYVFEPFRQLESPDTKRHGGTGLGLAISKKLVEMHGGEIWFESREGDGSTFYFTLPLSSGAH